MEAQHTKIYAIQQNTTRREFYCNQCPYLKIERSQNKQVVFATPGTKNTRTKVSK
jgi:hypothetical protein